LEVGVRSAKAQFTRAQMTAPAIDRWVSTGITWHAADRFATLTIVTHD
jgi:hypothetical protein